MTMQPNQAPIGEASILLLIAQLKQDGWIMLQPNTDPIGMMRKLTALLCRSLIPVHGRESYWHKFPEGDMYHTPIGHKAVLGHSERAYSPQGVIPDLCFFLCLDLTQSEHGGHFTVSDGELFLKTLPAALVERLRSEGVIYKMRWESRRWQQEFQTNRKQQVYALLANQPKINFHWDGDDLLISYHGYALRTSWTSGREAFANGILAHLPVIPTSIDASNDIYCKSTNLICWGDGSSMMPSEIVAMIKAHENICTVMPMLPGQMIILDNTRILHGRTKSSREIGSEMVSRFGLRTLNL